jgi:sulfur relay (sulfurtransferase) complex TusBCD TusD component (DsrE family)
MKGGAAPKISRVDTGKTLVEQGDHGHELFLLLDGVLGCSRGRMPRRG